jgi:hypothetical protein
MKERSGAVAHADHASAPLLFDQLRIEQREPRHPVGLGREAWGLAARRLEPLAEMREPGGGILLEPVCQTGASTSRAPTMGLAAPDMSLGTNGLAGCYGHVTHVAQPVRF